MNRSRRRQLLLAAAMLAIPGGVLAQERTYRMAYLGGGSAASAAPLLNALFRRLKELGYREGRNLVVDRRFADGNLDRLPALAAELVALKPDVIFAGTTPPTLAALKATRTIPIVFAAVGDPVGTGIVKSLARPGTNATGVSVQNAALQSKRLQMLKEILPAISRVAVLYNPLNAAELQFVTLLKNDAAQLGLILRAVEVASEAAFSQAFTSLDTERPDALYVIEGAFSFMHRARIVEFANSRRLPAVFGLSEFVDAGGLMSYSTSLIEQFRVAATYVARILKGARPAELPVEQASVFELVVNLKTARALGITVPQSILLRSDRVIE